MRILSWRQKLLKDVIDWPASQTSLWNPCSVLKSCMVDHGRMATGSTTPAVYLTGVRLGVVG
jgi:hypothetical protein